MVWGKLDDTQRSGRTSRRDCQLVVIGDQTRPEATNSCAIVKLDILRAAWVEAIVVRADAGAGASWSYPCVVPPPPKNVRAIFRWWCDADADLTPGGGIEPQAGNAK